MKMNAGTDPGARRTGGGAGAGSPSGDCCFWALGLAMTLYNMCKIDVGTGQQAVLDPQGGARARARHGTGPAPEGRQALL